MHYSWLMAVAVAVGLAAGGSAAYGQGTLVWSDDFIGTSLNTADWEIMIGDGTAYGTPAGWGNNELQYYTGRSQNLSVSGGYLHIIARAESYAGYNYTSARLRTLDKHDYLYGRIEARIKLPSTQGIWPAFWMLPSDAVYGGWAASGEIDIMESVNVATTVYGTIHYGGPWPQNTNSGGSVSGGVNYGAAFHDYAIEWEPDSIRWYVDGVFYHAESSSTWYSTAAPGNDRAPFDQYFHLLLNVAVGGNWPGAPNGSTVLPQEMLVDWVRVYAYEPPTQTPYLGQARAIPGVIQAEDFDNGGEGLAYHDCDGANQGGAYRASEGVDLEACSEGGFDVGWMCSGEWLEYSVEVAQTGTYRLQARVASQSTGGGFRVEFDGAGIAGAIVVPVTGGWQSWVTVTTLADLTAGPHVMRFVNTAGSSEYNVNWFSWIAIPPGDIDQDGDVDLGDVAAWVDCMSGAGVTTPPTGCTAAEFARCDLDDDGDVDLADFTTVQEAVGG